VPYSFTPYLTIVLRYIDLLLIGSVIPACLLGVCYCCAWCCVCLVYWCLLLSCVVLVTLSICVIYWLYAV